MRLFFNDDSFGLSVTVKAGTSPMEPRITEGQLGYIAGVTDVASNGAGSPGYSPANDVVLSWDTFTAAAQEAGISRLYGGIHIAESNQDGLVLGRLL